MTLWSAHQAALATGGQAVGDWAVTGVSIDTRTLQKGDLFVALKAARDGHDFVANALAAGAGAALVSRVPDGVDDTAPLLIVPDVQAALEDLGRAARARTKAKVIAVTGSVGKTSTKEMLRHMLGACGKTHASVASYNNHWGVPLTLVRMPADTEFAVIEIGMNHPSEIAPLAKMAAPDVAVVTTVAEVHLEAFDDITGIALEKASIIDGLMPNGVAIMNADTPCTKVIETYTKDVTTRWFGAAADDASLSDVQVRGAVTHAVLRVEGAKYPVTIGSAGRHFAMNALGALLAVGYLGADRRTAARLGLRYRHHRSDQACRRRCSTSVVHRARPQDSTRPNLLPQFCDLPPNTQRPVMHPAHSSQNGVPQSQSSRDILCPLPATRHEFLRP